MKNLSYIPLQKACLQIKRSELNIFPFHFPLYSKIIYKFKLKLNISFGTNYYFKIYSSIIFYNMLKQQGVSHGTDIRNIDSSILRNDEPGKNRLIGRRQQRL